MLAVIRSKRRRRRASGVVAKAILSPSELSAAFSRALSSASASISIARHLRDAHQAHRDREHARSRADIQRLLEAARRAKLLDRRERAVSCRMMPGAEGLSGVDDQPEPLCLSRRVAALLSQGGTISRRRPTGSGSKRSIHAVAHPGSSIRRRAGGARRAREHPGRSHRATNRRQAQAARAVRSRPGVPASRGDGRCDGRRRPRIPSRPRRPACPAASSTIAAGISKATCT